MPDIQITDCLGAAVPDVKIDLSQPSSLLKYAQAELFHLTVAPEFVERAPEKITAAAPDPISFDLTLQHEFQLGATTPEIDLTPEVHASLRVNTTKGSDLFAEAAFGSGVLVPGQTGYVGIGLQGSLDLGVSGSSGNLTFGCDAKQAVSLGYWKAFPLGDGEPTLGEATGQTISRFLIPAALDDLKLLKVNDISTASGQGSLKICGGFSVSAVPNPLASVNLPMNAGQVQVQAGPMAGISAAFTISGSYEIRARCTAPGTIELSVFKEHGTTLKTDLSASAGVAVNFGTTDLLQSLLSAISPKPHDDAIEKLFGDGGLSKDQVDALTGAIKDGLDHTLQVSLDAALCEMTDREAALQYEIRLDDLDALASAAVSRALRGDFSSLTGLEAGAAGAALAPGVKLVSSVLTTVRDGRITLKLNLLGLVNFISVADLIRKSTVVKDPGTGYLTIADSATAQKINAEVEPLRKAGALRKALFESLLLTATYRVSNAVQVPDLTSACFHFAYNQSTDRSTFADYLNWFVVLNLITQDQAPSLLNQFQTGKPSTCLLHVELNQGACESLFFKLPGQLWDKNRYLETGRQAMRALIDPNHSDADRVRYELLDQHWNAALQAGPTQNLGVLMGLDIADSTGQMITALLEADVYTIAWWADAMQKAGAAILDMHQFLAGHPAVGPDDDEFAARRDRLKKTMAQVMRDSQTEFNEPWGLVALFWAAGSAGASARLATNALVLQKPDAARAVVASQVID